MAGLLVFPHIPNIDDGFNSMVVPQFAEQGPIVVALVGRPDPGGAK